MPEQRYEIAFSGKIQGGFDLQSVKQQIGKLFKTEGARLEQMFSGKRVVIKHEADEITMIKYRGAFQKVGAICEIVALDNVANQAATQAAPQAAEATTSASAEPTSTDDHYASRYPESDVVPQALLTEPLGIRGEQIESLNADLAPVGSQVQDRIVYPDEPAIDTSGLDIAPVGSSLKTSQDDPPPPPPDTSGLTMS